MLACLVAAALIIAAAIDAIRYLRLDDKNKQNVQSQNTFPVSSAKQLILAYNVYGGIYSGIVDFVKKGDFSKVVPLSPLLPNVWYF